MNFENTGSLASFRIKVKDEYTEFAEVFFKMSFSIIINITSAILITKDIIQTKYIYIFL